MVPNFQDFLLPVLSALKDKKEHTSKELRDLVADQLNISDEDRNELLPSKKQTRFANRYYWAVVYLSQAKLITNVSTTKHARYVATKEGLALLAEKPDGLTWQSLMRYESFRDFQTRSRTDKKAQGPSQSQEQGRQEDHTPSEILETTFNQIQESLAGELLERVLNQSPSFFERLVVELMEKMGYGAGKITGRSGDEGIDGVIDEDKLGLDVIHIQAKRWAPDHKVSRPDLQQFVGALAGQNGNKGVFITTSSFSKEAMNFNPSGVKIVKIDGERLAKLMITYNVGVSVQSIYEIKKIDTDYFEE